MRIYAKTPSGPEPASRSVTPARGQPRRAAARRRTGQPARGEQRVPASVIALLHAQQPPYLANSVTLARLAYGPQVVRIEFAAPSL
jgi:hypothetical protein